MLGTERTDLHRTGGALRHRSPRVLTEDAALHQSSSPFTATTRSFPQPPQSCRQPPPGAVGEPRASGWGTAGVFIFDYCASWPTLRWGRGQENELVRGAQPNPSPSPTASQQRERRGDGGPGRLALTTWQRARLFLSVARHILDRGVLLLTLLLAAPELFRLAAGSAFIS